MLPPSAVFVVCVVVGPCLGDSVGDAVGETLAYSLRDSAADAPRDARFVRWEGPPVSVVTAISDRAFQLSEVLHRTARFFSAIATTYEDDNEIDREDKAPMDLNVVLPQDDTPSSALHGMYSECVLRLSVPCIQKKLMMFLDRLGRMDKLRLLGDFLSVVRVEPRDAGDTNYTADNEDSLAERFFATHSVRFSLPGTLRIARSPGLRTTVDLHFSKVISDRDNVGEGRGPLSGGGGNTKKKQKMLKKIKKRLMKILMMLMSVMMVMGPMMGGMAGGQAMLALAMGSLSLLISKALIIKKLGGSVTGLIGNIGSSIGNLAGIAGSGGGGGGGGGGTSSYFPTSTGGGPYSRIDPVAVDWARSFRSDVGTSFDPMSLVYNAYNMASYLR